MTAIARILYGPWDGPCGQFVVVPATNLTPGPENRLVQSAEVLSLPRKPGRFYDNINELYHDVGLGDRWVGCITLRDWTGEEFAPLMAGLDLDLVLVADDAGLALLHPDGRREALDGSVYEEGVLSAWWEWSRRRFPDGPALHRLRCQVGGWLPNMAQGMAEGRRLEAAYGHEAVEAAVQRIIAGVEPAVAVAEMAAGR